MLKWAHLGEPFEEVTGKRLDPVDLNKKMMEIFKRIKSKQERQGRV
jgi:hypothetical protein